jgi:hypothetical protein
MKRSLLKKRKNKPLHVRQTLTSKYRMLQVNPLLKGGTHEQTCLSYMYACTCLSKSASNTTDLHTIKHVLRHHSLDISQPVHTFSLLPSKMMSEELCLIAVACAITIVKQKYWKNKTVVKNGVRIGF